MSNISPTQSLYEKVLPSGSTFSYGILHLPAVDRVDDEPGQDVGE
jgi:hypothetical protein